MVRACKSRAVSQVTGKREIGSRDAFQTGRLAAPVTASRFGSDWTRSMPQLAVAWCVARSMVTKSVRDCGKLFPICWKPICTFCLSTVMRR